MRDKLIFNLQRTMFSRSIDLGIAVKHEDGSLSFATDVNFKKATKEDLCLFQPPILSMSPDEAQSLIDALWDCGLRPSEGSGSAGQLAATERHLSDMKEIAWHALKIPKKGNQS